MGPAVLVVFSVGSLSLLPQVWPEGHDAYAQPIQTDYSALVIGGQLRNQEDSNTQNSWHCSAHLQSQDSNTPLKNYNGAKFFVYEAQFLIQEDFPLEKPSLSSRTTTPQSKFLFYCFNQILCAAPLCLRLNWLAFAQGNSDVQGALTLLWLGQNCDHEWSTGEFSAPVPRWLLDRDLSTHVRQRVRIARPT